MKEGNHFNIYIYYNRILFAVLHCCTAVLYGQIPLCHDVFHLQEQSNPQYMLYSSGFLRVDVGTHSLTPLVFYLLRRYERTRMKSLPHTHFASAAANIRLDMDMDRYRPAREH